MKKRFLLLSLLVVIILTFTSTAIAQSYFFQVVREIVDVYWNEDGTLSIVYILDFNNRPTGHPIDYVDIGIPNNHFETSKISASIDGNPITFISESEFQGEGGSGIALGLGSHAIQPGDSGQLIVNIEGVTRVLYTDSTDDTYASAVFAPNWFGSAYVYGPTDILVRFHLPPGINPDEPRWHSAPSGFPDSPETFIDDDGRIVYQWQDIGANAYTYYEFGASFPKAYVPESAIVTPSLFDNINIKPGDIAGLGCWGSFIALMVGISILSTVSQKRRKLKYLPPKIRIEGHGIKRGLTAVEAAILLETPIDKILTMILFSSIKKSAATVTSRDPLKIAPTEPIPKGLRGYEKRFIEAFEENNLSKRKKMLQNLMIWLIRETGKKMKGFSHKETVTYYQNIVDRAWEQIERADTPDVKSKYYDDYMGWTMLDKDFDSRTEDVFRTGPVIVPSWWHHYDPGWQRSGQPAAQKTVSPGGSIGRSAPSMPNLPGGTFAASMVKGIQDFSSSAVGNLSSFTEQITQKTNPAPKSSGGSRSGGGSCACACACAGCACACAGGGR